MKKKILLTLGSVSSLALTATAVSCSTSWTKWDQKTNNKRPEYTFPKPQIEAKKFWDISSDLSKSWDVNTQTLDISKVRNQYELIKIIGDDILGLKPNAPVDTYWDDEDKMKTYVSNIKSPIYEDKSNGANNQIYEFTIKDGKNKNKISWNIDKVKKEIIDSIDSFKQMTPQDQKSERAFDIKNNGGINATTKTPNNLAGVATAGRDFMGIEIVQGLLSENASDAMKLSKLVNLPKGAFNGFTSLLRDHMDKVLDEVLKASTVINWQTKNMVNWNLQKNGTYYSKKQEVNSQEEIQKRFKGLFLINTLE